MAQLQTFKNMRRRSPRWYELYIWKLRQEWDLSQRDMVGSSHGKRVGKEIPGKGIIGSRSKSQRLGTFRW